MSDLPRGMEVMTVEQLLDLNGGMVRQTMENILARIASDISLRPISGRREFTLKIAFEPQMIKQGDQKKFSGKMHITPSATTKLPPFGGVAVIETRIDGNRFLVRPKSPLDVDQPDMFDEPEDDNVIDATATAVGENQ